MIARFALSCAAVLLTSATAAYARCQDITYCRIDPATGKEICRVYKNVCTQIPSPLANSTSDKTRSLRIRGLTEEQARRVLDALGVDQTKVKPP